MALQMDVTAEGLAKFRSAMETGALVTLASAELYAGYSDGAVSGAKVATMTVRSNNNLDPNSNVYRFTCQDKEARSYTAYSGKILDAGGVVVATFHNNGAAVATKEEKSEILIGCEIHFEDSVKVSDVVNMGDTSFYFEPDEATTEAKGVIEIATEAEAKAKTDATRAITPKTLDAVIENHANVVHKKKSETISGTKTFTGGVNISNGSPSLALTQTDIARGDTPTARQPMGVSFLDRKGDRLGFIESVVEANGDVKLNIYAYDPNQSAGGYKAVEFCILASKSGTSKVTVSSPVEGANGNEIAVASWVKALAAKYLPLAGGTMSGNISFSGETGRIYSKNEGGRILITGGSDESVGAALFIMHKNNEGNYKGGVWIRTVSSDGEFKSLLALPNGTLEWDGKNVVRSVNGTNADAAGNVVIPSNFVRLTGDMMTGNLNIAKASPYFAMKLTDAVRAETPTKRQVGGIEITDKNGDRLGLITSAKETNGDVNLQFYTYDPNQNSGEFKNISLSIVAAKDGNSRIETAAKLVLSKGDLTLTEGIIKKGRLTDALDLCSGTAYNDSPAISLYPMSFTTDTNMRGWFIIRAGANAKQFLGKPDGTLMWDGKNIVRSVNGTTADAAGNVVITFDARYLKLTGGTLTGALIISSGNLTLSNGDMILTKGNIRKSDKTDAINICSGTSYEDSPTLSLYPTSYATEPAMAGRFALRAGANAVQLIGTADGKLTWGGKELLRVVESWSSGDNWYRKYSDGWIEQGGTVSNKQSWLNNPTVTMNTSFTTTSYSVVVSWYDSAGSTESGSGVAPCVTNKTNVTFGVDAHNSTKMGLIWYACGK